MVIRSLLPALLPLCVASVLGACAESPSAPTASPTPGTYLATRLEVTENGEVADMLAEGFSVRLVLNEDGSTAGTFHMAYAEAPGDPPADVPLDGTWRVERRGGEAVVVLDQPAADTFLRDTPLSFTADRLVGDFQTVHVELRRQ